jgi:hypothetical protein
MTYKKWFINVTDFLWDNRKRLAKEYRDTEVSDDYAIWDQYLSFEYNYGGLKKSIANRLSGDFVDAIESIWPELLAETFKTKKEFIKELLDQDCWNPLGAVK